MGLKRYITAALAILAAATSVGAVAWACTPSAYIHVSGSSFAPGSSMTITGQGFIDAPVEIRWTGSGARVLATASGPSFSVTVTVPAVAPGTYYVDASARDANGTVIGHATRAVRVSAPTTTPTAPAAGPPRATAPERAPASLTVDGSRADRAPSPSRQPARTAGRSPDAAPAPSDTPSATAPARPRRATGTSTSPLRTPSEAGRRPAAAPSPRAASGDLWSGFGAGDRAGSLSRVSAPVERPGSELLAGLVLLALGLAGLGGGIAAARGRRRAAARSPR